MTPLAQEWVDKAEADWIATGQLIRVRKSPNYDLICYEAQQSAEKYLKARLVEAGLSVARTHNLLHLLGLLPDEAKDARKRGVTMRAAVRVSLGLPV